MNRSHPLESAQGGWSGLLRPLVPLYAGVVAARNTAYARQWLRSSQLRAPVISVGNLSVGGSGKTPLVIRLAQLLAARGLAVDVLSRGYGRQSRATERVHPEADGASAERYGDEPLLIARASGVPVYVGASRYAAGLLAEQGGGSPRVHLLDDGFQHRQLARAVDIVVLHGSDFAAGLLPAGRLREPLAALGRASIAVLREEDAALEPGLRGRFRHLRVWLMKREIALPEQALGQPAFAFCGIGYPEEFFTSLARAGAEIRATRAFRDHHAWTDQDVSGLVRGAQASGARWLLTTEKDLVRMSASHRAVLGEAARLAAVPLRVRLLGEDAAIREMLLKVGLPADAGC